MQSYIETVKKVLFQPKQFFEEMPLNEGYGGPLIFAATNAAFASLLSISKDLFLGNITQNSITLIIQFLTVLVMAVISLFIAYGLIHIILKLVGAKKNFEATFRVGAYLSAFWLLTWIPYLWILIAIYVLYLEIVTFAKIHEISTSRSFFAVMLIPAILLILTIMAAGLSYIWISGLQNDVKSQVQKDLQTNTNTGNAQNQIVSRMNTQISIDSVFENNNKLNVLLKNVGQNTVSGKGLTMYLDGVRVDSPKCGDIKLSEICTIVLNETTFPQKGSTVTIRIITADGVEAQYRCIGTGNNFC